MKPRKGFPKIFFWFLICKVVIGDGLYDNCAEVGAANPLAQDGVYHASEDEFFCEFHGRYGYQFFLLSSLQSANNNLNSTDRILLKYVASDGSQRESEIQAISKARNLKPLIDKLGFQVIFVSAPQNEFGYYANGEKYVDECSAPNFRRMLLSTHSNQMKRIAKTSNDRAWMKYSRAATTSIPGIYLTNVFEIMGCQKAWVVGTKAAIGIKFTMPDIFCPDISPSKNLVTGSNPPYLPSTEVVIQCEDEENMEFEEKGGINMTITCTGGPLETPSWDEKPIPSCKYLRCPGSPPEGPAGSTSNFIGTTDVGTVVTYTCSSDVTTSSVYMQCSINGNWIFIGNKTLTDCAAKVCPTTPLNDYVVNGSVPPYRRNDQIVLQCPDENMEFENTGSVNMTITCVGEVHEVPSWNVEEFPRCIYTRCPPPPAAPNGVTSDYQGISNVDTIVTYTCSEELNFDWHIDKKTSVQIQCSDNGNWTALEYQQLEICTSKGCPNPPPEAPDYSTFDYFGQSAVGSVVTYTCYEGMGFNSTADLKSSVKLQCTSDYNWTVIEQNFLGNCVLKECLNIENMKNASTPTNLQSTEVVLRCEDEKNMQFDNTGNTNLTITCVGDEDDVLSWSENDILPCKYTRCPNPPPETPDIATYDYKNISDVGTVVTYSCSKQLEFHWHTSEEKYVQMECTADGNWTILDGKSLEICPSKGCLDIPPDVPEGSTYDYSGISNVGTIVTYTCSPGLGFNSSTGFIQSLKVQCTSNGTWMILDDESLRNCIPKGRLYRNCAEVATVDANAKDDIYYGFEEEFFCEFRETYGYQFSIISSGQSNINNPLYASKPSDRILLKFLDSDGLERETEIQTLSKGKGLKTVFDRMGAMVMVPILKDREFGYYANGNKFVRKCPGKTKAGFFLISFSDAMKDITLISNNRPWMKYSNNATTKLPDEYYTHVFEYMGCLEYFAVGTAAAIGIKFPMPNLLE